MKEELTMEEAMAGFSLNKVKDGDILEGSILKVSKEEIIVNINYFADGVIPREELTKDHGEDLTTTYQVGDLLKVIVLKADDGEGNVLLSKIKADAIVAHGDLEKALENKTPVKVYVQEVVKGGLRVFYQGLSGFMPASLISDSYVENLQDFAQKTLDALVEEYDEEENKLIFSRRALLKVQGEKNKKKLLQELKEGDSVEGVVANLAAYGAFIDLGGLTGLAHISDLSYRRIQHPSEVLSVGDAVIVHIQKIDRKNEKISLSLKNKAEDPWMRIGAIKVGSFYEGTVKRLIDAGAIVELENSIDGLVHISEISSSPVSHAKEVLQEGQQVKVKVMDIDEDRKRISFSLREGEEEQSFYDEEDAVTLGDVFSKLMEQFKGDE